MVAKPMNKKLRLALIGAGNVMKTRHLPALLRNVGLFELRGIVDVDITRSKQLADKHRIPHYSGLDGEHGISTLEWFNEVDAVIIGVPPQGHYPLARECLLLGKHVLVEKPLALKIEEAKDLVSLAKAKHLVLAVKHNFQYAKSVLKLDGLLKNGELGRVQSIYCVQLTNQARRIPAWVEELPYGLFFDESPHYFYLTRKITGDELRIKSVYRSRSRLRSATPEILNLNLESGNIPVTVYWNFDSPVCEWQFIIIGEKKMAAVDLFRDILILLPNDTPHLGYQVMRTSILSAFQHWKGVAVNGLSYLQNKLNYGFDISQQNFHRAVTSGDVSHIQGMSGEDGLCVTEIQNEIVRQLDANG